MEGRTLKEIYYWWHQNCSWIAAACCQRGRIFLHQEPPLLLTQGLAPLISGGLVIFCFLIELDIPHILGELAKRVWFVMVPLQLQPNIILASGSVDHLLFCRLMLELASGKTTVMGEAGDGWFSVFSSSPTLFENLCIVCTWFHTLTNLSFFGISRGVFSLLHTSHCVGQRQQGLYTAKGSHKSLLQVFKSLGMSGNQNWTSSDFLTCSTIVDAAFFLSEIHSLPSFQCSGLEEFF